MPITSFSFAEKETSFKAKKTWLFSFFKKPFRACKALFGFNKFKLNLEPGEYYWKLDHSFSINFKIPSRVSIKSVNKNITNDGNVKEVLSNKFTTFAILNPSESRELKEVYNVTAEQA